jgi:uncharacterized protein YdaU (DUF1376 family)
VHYYKKNIGDYAKKAGRLTMLQHGSYTLLLDACYDREKFPTLDEAIEWTWASTTEEVEAVTFVLKKFFVLEDGVYVQNRIREELENFHNNSQTNKRIAIEREAKRKNKSTDREQSVDEPSPNHKPITNNHIKESKDSLSAGLPTCPHQEILNLYKKHLPQLAQPRVWDGVRQTNLRQRWLQAAKPSSFSLEGYSTQADGLAWWDSFFAYIANDTKLAHGFETKDRTWRPDLVWIVNATNFAKIIDGKYQK